MTIREAARKWSLSENWVRDLVKTGRVPAIFNTAQRVGYWDIPDETPAPARTVSLLAGTSRPTPAPREPRAGRRRPKPAPETV